MCARPANPELRQKILDAAADIVENCGPDCVTMREVAEKVGYSPTSIYLHFKDKHEMLREVVLYGFEDFATSMRSLGGRPGRAGQAAAAGARLSRVGIDHPGMYQLMFESRIDLVTGEAQDERARQGLIDGAAILQEAISAGELRQPDDDCDARRRHLVRPPRRDVVGYRPACHEPDRARPDRSWSTPA